MDEQERKNIESAADNKPAEDARINDFFARLRENDVLEDLAAPATADDLAASLVRKAQAAEEAAEEGAEKAAEETAEEAAVPAGKVFRAGSAKAAADGRTKKSGGRGKKSAKTVDEGNLTPKQLLWRKIMRIALYVCCIGIICGCALAIALSIYLVDVTSGDSEILDLNSLKLKYSTVLLAQDKESGEWIEYERIYGDENRVWVNYSEFPEHLINATIASEDQRFLKHHGVDWKRTAFAILNEVFSLREGTQGGSTITQQLIKNITDEKQVSGLDGILRKVREIFRALTLEKSYSKEQILEAYLNTFRLSGQVAGIESAANTYFGKSTSELTVAECAAIVCITKYPVQYDPYAYPDANKQQRENVLYYMNQYGLLEDADYQKALAESETMTFKEGGASRAGHVYSYFTDAVINAVLDDLVEYNGLSEAEAYTMFYEEGLRVYLTIDLDVQAAVEEVMGEGEMWDDLVKRDGDEGWGWYMYTLDENGNETTDRVQGAMVVMDYEGRVLGVAGGVGEKTESLGLNRAVDSLRQTGSSMKPIAVYAPALELNKINYSSLIEDSPSEVVSNQPWPRNYDNSFGSYGSSVTVYKAVCVSLNTIAVKTMKMIGYDFAYDFLETRLGITSLVDEDNGIYNSEGKLVTDRTLSLGLGGLSYGISPLEMCAAYAPFGNGGTYTTPHFYTQVVNSRGEVVLDSAKTVQTIKALSDDTAYIMNKILQGVVREGTGTSITREYTRNGSLPVAAKSGTTSDNKDYWFVGMNPYYVCAVWEGLDEPDYVYTARPHPTQLAFGRVMEMISEDLEAKSYPSAEGVFAVTVCKASGDLASPACPETMTGWYKKGYAPTITCNHALAPIVEDPTNPGAPPA